jgi:hypothetical protein
MPWSNLDDAGPSIAAGEFAWTTLDDREARANAMKASS